MFAKLFGVKAPLFYVYYVKVKCMFTLNGYYNFYIPILFILINLLSKF